MASQATVGSGPQVGDLIPDFTVHTLDGRTIHRRNYKGRRHLLVAFVPPGDTATLDALGQRYPAIQAAGGDLLVARVGEEAIAPDAYRYPLVLPPDASELRRRFGIVAPTALIVCDRYGEVALRIESADASALDEGVAVLEWLEMRCSL